MPLTRDEFYRLSARRPGVEDRLEELCANFEFYLARFDELNPFTGPSVYFHLKTLERLKQIGLPAAFEDKLFLEYLYATLASWGMHRMGPTGAKLVEFTDFVRTLKSQKDEIISLQNIKLTQLTKEELQPVTDKLWSILSNLKVSISETQLVAGSKTLHHLLPDLMPPIDRAHTLRFIYGYDPVYSSEEQKFRRVFPQLWKIGVRKRDIIPRWIGRGFHTSETKVIDNAIVGYVKTKMKGQIGGGL